MFGGVQAQVKNRFIVSNRGISYTCGANKLPGECLYSSGVFRHHLIVLTLGDLSSTHSTFLHLSISKLELTETHFGDSSVSGIVSVSEKF